MSSTTRKLCRSGAHCEPVSLKEACDCVGHHSDRPLREIAERIGRTESQLGKECSLYDEEHCLPLRLVVPLTLAAENDALITYLAQAVGGVFVRIHAAHGRGVDQEHAAQVVTAFGELLTRYGAALADGTITVREAEQIETAGAAACQAIVELQLYARQRATAHVSATERSAR
jgi:hypothetical protein